MAAERVRIRRLALRLPGLDREGAERLGRSAARQLADQLPAGTPRGRLGAIRVNLRPAAGTRVGELPAAIARRLGEALRWR